MSGERQKPSTHTHTPKRTKEKEKEKMMAHRHLKSENIRANIAYSKAARLFLME